MEWACLEDGPRIDNCGETDTTKWKRKPDRSKIDWMQTVN